MRRFQLARRVTAAAVLPFLVGCATTQVPKGRERSEIQQGREINRLVQATQSKSPQVRMESLKELASLGVKQAIPAIKESLLDADPRVCVWSCYALAKMGVEKEEYVRMICAALAAHWDYQTQCEAAVALGMLGSAAESAVPALTRSLYFPYRGRIGARFNWLFLVYHAVSGVREELGVPPDPEGQPAFVVPTLKDPYIRRLAARALGNVGPAAKEAVPALSECLQDELVRKDAVEAIKKISGQESGYNWRESWKGMAR